MAGRCRRKVGIRESGDFLSRNVCFHVIGGLCTGVLTRAAESRERYSGKRNGEGAGMKTEAEVVARVTNVTDHAEK